MSRTVSCYSLLLVIFFLNFLSCDLLDKSENTFEDTEEVTAGVDTDGDGLEDSLEIEGYYISVDDTGDGVFTAIKVTSDPDIADTDGDGLSDYLERSYNSNPNIWDTDGDGLQDYYEYQVSKTSPNSKDTDGDGQGKYPLMFDGSEDITYGTSPSLADTDGDGIDDYTEINTVSTVQKALLANVNRLQFTIVGKPSISFNYKITETSTTNDTEETFTSDFERVVTDDSLMSYQSEEAIHSTDYQYHEEASAEYSTRKGGKASAEVSADQEIFDQTTTFNSSCFSLSKTNENYSQIDEMLSTTESNSKTVEISNGTITVNAEVTNLGDSTVEVTDVYMGVYINETPENANNKQLITSIAADFDKTIARNGTETITFVFDDLQYTDNFAKALEYPEYLSFQIINYNLSDPTDNELNYSSIGDNVSSRDVVIKVDKCDGSLQEFFVAANVLRNDDGTYKGITLGEALEICGIEYETVTSDDGSTVFSSIDGTSSGTNDGVETFWLCVSAPGIEIEGVDAEDIILFPGSTDTNTVNLILVQNSDSDVLWDFEDDDIYNPRYALKINLDHIRYSGDTATFPEEVTNVKYKLDLTLSRADAADEQTITVFEDYQFYPAGTRQDFTDDPQYETWITPIFTSSEDYLTFTLWANLEMTLYYGTTTRTVNIPHYNHWWWSSDDNRWERSTSNPDSKAESGLLYYSFYDGHYGIDFDGNATLGVQYDIEVTNDYTVE